MNTKISLRPKKETKSSLTELQQSERWAVPADKARASASHSRSRFESKQNQHQKSALTTTGGYYLSLVLFQINPPPEVSTATKTSSTPHTTLLQGPEMGSRWYLHHCRGVCDCVSCRCPAPVGCPTALWWPLSLLQTPLQGWAGLFAGPGCFSPSRHRLFPLPMMPWPLSMSYCCVCSPQILPPCSWFLLGPSLGLSVSVCPSCVFSLGVFPHPFQALLPACDSAPCPAVVLLPDIAPTPGLVPSLAYTPCPSPCLPLWGSVVQVVWLASLSSSRLSLHPHPSGFWICHFPRAHSFGTCPHACL